VQGIFTRRLRKRIHANTLTNGQTNRQTHSQNIMRCQTWAPQSADENILLRLDSFEKPYKQLELVPHRDMQTLENNV
jgi:hypothetical protein